MSVAPDDRGDRPIRVLLFSPVAGVDPPSGDLVYTSVLVGHPPRSVEYSTYDDALRSGAIRERGRWRDRASWRVTDVLWFLLRFFTRPLRGRVLFLEEPRFITIRPGAFDLVHQHVFPVRQVGGVRLPVLTSSGCPLSEMYRNRGRMRRRQAALAHRLERGIARAFGIDNPGIWQSSGTIATGWTRVYVEFMESRLAGVPVRLIGQALPSLGPDDVSWATRSSRSRSGRTVAFVGHDFVRKGGPQVLDSARLLPDVKFLVATGGIPERFDVPSNVTVHPRALRDFVLDELLPSADVFVMPSSDDCGAPYALIEALRLGLPIIIRPNTWLSERLKGSAVHLTDRTPQRLADDISGLLEPTVLENASYAAIELFNQSFSLNRLSAELASGYGAALSVASAARVEASGPDRV